MKSTLASGGPASTRPSSQPAPPEVVTFRSSTGWQLGDVSMRLRAQGLSIQITVKSSTIADRHYYQAELCSAGAAWNGGMRLTATYPERTHNSIRVPSGGCARWSEHLTAGARDIYVLVQQDRGG